MSAGMLELQSTSCSTVPSSSLSTHSRAVGSNVVPVALRLAALPPPGELNRPEELPVALTDVLAHGTAEPGAPGPAEAPVPAGPTASSEVDLLSSASGRLDVELLE